MSNQTLPDTDPLATPPSDEPEGPLWEPDEQRIRKSRLYAFMRDTEEGTGRQFNEYADIWRWSIENTADFWGRVWDFCGIIGEKGDTVLENGGDMQKARFFPQARLNYAENMLRRTDTAPAIIFRTEAGKERMLSFEDVYNAVSRLRQAMIDAGVGKGDRVAGYLPNMPETIIGALAAASIGAIWSSASPDFGVQGVVDRFGQVEPKILICVDGYFYNGKVHDSLANVAGIEKQLPGLEKTLVIPFASENPDISGLAKGVLYADFVAPFEAGVIDFEPLPFDYPLFIMFSSGTTGIPKCMVHGHGGTLIQHLKEHQLQCDIGRDDTIFYFTTCGWMMWNWLISGLASGATLLLYDGSPFYPDGEVLWGFTQTHKAKMFGTAAKYIDALRNGGVRPGDGYNLDHLRILTSTGSPLVHESFDYIYDAIKSDLHVASISGGTDIVSCFVLGNPISPVWRGEIQGPGLGMAVDVYDSEARPVPPGGGAGELVCTRPFPSMPVKFWNDPEGENYRKAYFDTFDGIWCHGDWLEKTIHGGFIIHGRSDATLNPGGVRIGTAEIYRQVEKIDEVWESVAVGQNWQGDQRVILFVVLKDGVSLDEDLVREIRTRIRKGASPRHMPAKIIQVSDIPRTKSNKITEIAVRDVIHGKEIKNKEALANPQALELYRDLPDLQKD